MRQADLSRLGIRAAADQGYLRNRMMRGAERPLRNQRTVPSQLTGHGMYLRGLQTLAQGQGRKDGRQTLGHHGLSASRRTNHDDIMPPGRSHLKGTLHLLLSLHVGEIKIEMGLLGIELGPRVDFRRLQVPFIVQELDDLPDMVRAVHLQLVHHSGLTHILLRNNQMLISHLTGLDGHRKRPLHGLQAAIEAQLTQQHGMRQLVRFHLPVRGQNTHRQRQIKTSPFLADVRRRHVNHKLFGREAKPAVLDSRHDAFMALPHGIVRQSHQIKLDAPCRIHFYRDRNGGKPLDRRPINFYQHDPPTAMA